MIGNKWALDIPIRGYLNPYGRNNLMDIEKYIEDLEAVIAEQNKELNKYQNIIDEVIYKMIDKDYPNALKILLNSINKDFHSDYLFSMVDKYY